MLSRGRCSDEKNGTLIVSPIYLAENFHVQRQRVPSMVVVLETADRIRQTPGDPD